MRKKAVFLTLESPYPALGGTQLREAHLIQLLAEHMDVELLCLQPEGSRFHHEPVPRNIQVSVIPRDRTPLWRWLTDPLRPDLMTGYSEDVAEALRERAEPGKLLWISRIEMAQYLGLAKSLGYKTVLDERDVVSTELLEGASGSKLKLLALFKAAQIGFYESRFCQRSDAIVASCDLDASRVRKLAPRASVHVIPHSVDAQAYREVRELAGDSLFFCGHLGSSRVAQGLQWFASEVFPRLRMSLGPAVPRIVVAGSRPTRRIREILESMGAELVGDPISLIPYLRTAAVVFDPTREGGGSRIRILEAMAAGRVVVSTGKAAEGLVLSPSYDVWIADAPDSFASAILRTITDTTLRREMGIHAYQTIEARYDLAGAQPKMLQLLNTLKIESESP